MATVKLYFEAVALLCVSREGCGGTCSPLSMFCLRLPFNLFISLSLGVKQDMLIPAAELSGKAAVSSAVVFLHVEVA